MYPWAHLFPIIPNVRDLSGEAEHNHPICTELQSNSGRTFLSKNHKNQLAVQVSRGSPNSINMQNLLVIES